MGSIQHTRSVYQPGPTALSVSTATSPSRMILSDASGTLATLTVGSKTVAMRGPTRTFTEVKRTFTDAFARTVAAGWGNSPSGGSWGNFQGANADYSVSTGKGRVASATQNVSRYVRVNNTLKTVDFRVKVTLDTLPTGASSSIGAIFGWAGVSNHYRARMTFNTTGSLSATLAKNVAAAETILAGPTTVHTGWVANEEWWIRVTHDGVSALAMYTWADGDVEPVVPTLTASDSTFTQGDIGVRVLTSTGGNVLNAIFEDFTVTAATWPTNPTVTHNTWVRVLSTPFSGTLTDAILNQVRAWAVDDSPDVLGLAVSYITNSPTVTSPALGGKTVFSQAEYGPLDTDGTRIEGADFNDYIGISWVYPPSGGGTTDNPEAAQLHCLDCSGFVRMLFGYWLSLPMTLANAAFFDGLNIPRNTANMGPFGPGLVVASAVGVPPSLTALQIGDVLFFDADPAEPVEGQIDHCGIYLGLDGASMRFISSRKTVSGPTFGDLGGASVINSGGAGTYTVRLRSYRRF